MVCLSISGAGRVTGLSRGQRLVVRRKRRREGGEGETRQRQMDVVGLVGAVNEDEVSKQDGSANHSPCRSTTTVETAKKAWEQKGLKQ